MFSPVQRPRSNRDAFGRNELKRIVNDDDGHYTVQSARIKVFHSVELGKNKYKKACHKEVCGVQDGPMVNIVKEAQIYTNMLVTDSLRGELERVWREVI